MGDRCGGQVWETGGGGKYGGTGVGDRCGRQVCETGVGDMCGGKVWGTGVSDKCGRQVWGTGVADRCGGQVCQTGVADRCGRQVRWTPTHLQVLLEEPLVVDQLVVLLPTRPLHALHQAHLEPVNPPLHLRHDHLLGVVDHLADTQPA